MPLTKHEVECAREFIEDLKDYRQNYIKEQEEKFTRNVGPLWYHIFSTKQLKALESLPEAIHRDLIEDRPRRTMSIMFELGLNPFPSQREMMTSVILGRRSATGFLAELFKELFSHDIRIKRKDYPHNAKLLMSAVFYMDYEDLLHLLRMRFHVPMPEIMRELAIKKTREGGPYESPYLEPFIVKSISDLSEEQKKKPPPIPSPSKLFEGADEEESISMPPPPEKPPPPPPPKDLIAQEVCDLIGDYSNWALQSPEKKAEPKPAVKVKDKKGRKKSSPGGGEGEGGGRGGGGGGGGGSEAVKVPKVKRAGPPPSAPFPHCILHMGGVTKCNGELVYYLHGVIAKRNECTMLHLGMVYVASMGQYVPQYGGCVEFSGFEPEKPCDCMKWFDLAKEYIDAHKCTCDHYYDFPESEPSTVLSIVELDEFGNELHKDDEEEKVDDKKAKRDGKGAKDSDKKPDAEPEKKKKKKIIVDVVPSVKYFMPPTRTDPGGFNDDKIFETESVLNMIKETVENFEDEDSVIGLEPSVSNVQSETNENGMAMTGRNKSFLNKSALNRSMMNRSMMSKSMINKSMMSKSNMGDLRMNTKKGKRRKERDVPKPPPTISAESPPADVLKAVMRTMKHDNAAAALPESYLVPELLEWMRKRMKGPLTDEEKEKIRLSISPDWDYLNIVGFGKPPRLPRNPFKKDEMPDWSQKGLFADRMEKEVQKYRFELYKYMATRHNVLWSTMHNEKYLDPGFRRTYFAYMPQTVRSIHIYRPYDPAVAMQMRDRKKYICKSKAK